MGLQVNNVKVKVTMQRKGIGSYVDNVKVKFTNYTIKESIMNTCKYCSGQVHSYTKESKVISRE